jgi:hypothetical protein
MHVTIFGIYIFFQYPRLDVFGKSCSNNNWYLYSHARHDHYYSYPHASGVRGLDMDNKVIHI